MYCTGNAVDEVSTTTFIPPVNTIGSSLSIGGSVTTIDRVPVCSDDNKFDIGNLRYAAGLGAVWISPLGVMSFSISTPFNNEVGDDTEQFQFNIGTSF